MLGGNCDISGKVAAGCRSDDGIADDVLVVRDADKRRSNGALGGACEA